jgi:hypothetical protein
LKNLRKGLQEHCGRIGKGVPFLREDYDIVDHVVKSVDLTLKALRGHTFVETISNTGTTGVEGIGATSTAAISLIACRPSHIEKSSKRASGALWEDREGRAISKRRLRHSRPCCQECRPDPKGFTGTYIRRDYLKHRHHWGGRNRGHFNCSDQLDSLPAFTY